MNPNSKSLSTWKNLSPLKILDILLKSNAFESQIIDSTPSYITISNGPFSGSYYLNAVGDPKPAFLLIPVNGGSTILLTELNTTKTSSTGVCQKI